MATIKDIARAVGVSARTVSRALNATGSISSELKERIETVARAMNYTPNRAAQLLRSGQSREVRVLTWSFDELVMQKIAALEKSLAEEGYQTALHSLGHHRETDPVSIARKIRLESPVGVVIVGGGAVAEVIGEELLSGGMKVVYIDSYAQVADGTGVIGIDRNAGVYSAVCYLAKGFDGEIAYAGIKSSEKNNWSRVEGYRRAIYELGREPVELYAVEHIDEFVCGMNVADEIVRRKIPAVQCYSDVMAMGVLNKLAHSGLKVPQDVRVVGFDNRNFSAYATPPLTTVSQPNAECGRTAARMLLESMQPQDGDNSAVEKSLPVMIPTDLIVRQST